MNSLENFTNAKRVEEFVEFINSRVQVANAAWNEIAEAFAEAREMYGCESDSFKKLLKETKFSKSTANKLASIATSERLKRYKDKLVAVHSWSTLYAIHSLSDEFFAKFKEKFKFDDEKTFANFITLNDVNNVKSESIERSPYKAFTTIQINEDALRGLEMDGGDLVRLRELIEEIENTVPYVKVLRTGIDDKIETDYMRKVEKYKETIIRTKISKAIDSVIERQYNMKKNKEKYKILFGESNKNDVITGAIGDVEGFFGKYGFEYEEAKIYDEAISKASEWCSKIGNKVVNKYKPFENADSSYVSAEIQKENQLAEVKEYLNREKARKKLDRFLFISNDEQTAS